MDVAPYPPVDGTQPCAAEDPEVFFTTGSRQAAYSQPRALAACARCPFRRECLAFALTHHVQGIWGGTTEPQRKKLRKKHGIKAVYLASELAEEHELILELDQQGLTAGEIAARVGRTHRDSVTRTLVARRGYLTDDQFAERTARGQARKA